MAKQGKMRAEAPGATSGSCSEQEIAALRIPILPQEAPRLPTPPGFLLPLLPYQERSLARMVQVESDGKLRGADFNTHLDYMAKGGVLADKIGMGKTAMVLGLIMQEPESDFHGPTLVIAPGHLLQQWETEARKFCSPTELRVINGLDALKQARASGGRLNNRALVLVNVSDVLTAQSVQYEWQGRNLRWPPEEVEKARKIACSISGGYAGPIWLSPLHSMKAVCVGPCNLSPHPGAWSQ